MSMTIILHTNLVKKSSIDNHVTRNPKLKWQRVSSTCRRGGSHPFCHLTTHSTSRRSGNYHPPLWSFHYIQSLDENEFMEGRCLTMASELIEQVKKLLDEEMEAIRHLELIDDLQRLGISYHFENKIHEILNRIYLDDHKCCKNNKMTTDDDEEEICRDLYSTALKFRILREHGFKVSQEAFDCFMEEGDFKTSIAGDAKGLLELYEVSFLSKDGEESLELARDFATTSLLNICKLDDHRIEDRHLSLLVGHALELPLHWRSRRPYAAWFISCYERRPDMNPVVLQLAKLDFNILQATHRAELKSLSRWWKQTCLAEKLPFARDRVVECYLLTIGLFEPQYGYSRIIGTKVNALVTIIDDMFDVYATMEELTLFNNVIQRWDIEAIDQLPHYMQMCFLALNNFINEMAYDVLKQQGFQIISYLRKSWADLITSYMQEAKWYSEGYKPRLEEYVENAWISISVPVMLSHAFFALANPIEKEAVQSLFQYHDLVRYSGTIARLANDLGTSQDEVQRGDVPKSLECCMNERGIDIDEARDHIKLLISEAWKKMNDHSAADSHILPQQFVRCAVEFGRIAHYVYEDGDGHGIQNSKVKRRISTLLFHPIP